MLRGAVHPEKSLALIESPIRVDAVTLAWHSWSMQALAKEGAALRARSIPWTLFLGKADAAPQESYGKSILVPAMVVVALQTIYSHAIARASPSHVTLEPVSSLKSAFMISTRSVVNIETPHVARSELVTTSWLLPAE